MKLLTNRCENAIITTKAQVFLKKKGNSKEGVMKKKYTQPEAELLLRLHDDVILTSEDTPVEDDEEEEE